MSGQVKPLYRFGPFVLNAADRLLWKGDRVVPLTPKSAEILVLLLKRSGQLVEKSELLTEVWPDTFVDEANLSRQIYELRKALGDLQEQQYIKTIPRRGYRFAAELRKAQEYTDNIEAYHEYLRGRYHWNKRTEEGLAKGIRHFQQAIEIDPAYALAYAGLGDCYLILGNMAIRHPHDSYPKAKAAAEKAIEIDEYLAEGYSCLAGVRLFYERDRLRAEQNSRRAVELNPNYATGHHLRSFILAAMGRMDDAIAEIKRAHQIDPLSPMINTNLGTILYWARQYERAIQQYQETLEMDPNFWPAHWMLGMAYVQTRTYKAAISALSRACELVPDSLLPKAALGYAYATSRARSQALEVLRELRSEARRRYVGSYGIAKIYAELGDEKHALDYFHKASAEHDPWSSLVDIDPDMDHFRSNPRYEDVVRTLGTPARDEIG